MEFESITLGRHIDRLEAKGWVERRRDPADRRAWKLFLQPKAQPVLDCMRELSEMTRQEALAGVPDAEREQLIELLLTIKANMVAIEEKEKAAPSARTMGDTRV